MGGGNLGQLYFFLNRIHMYRFFIPFLLMHLLIAAVSRGQGGTAAADRAVTPADTIRPGKGHLMTDVLQPGLRQYLVYFQNPKQPRALNFWYWMRDIAVGA